jgi:chemotaxis protein methyltransferase CheR
MNSVAEDDPNLTKILAFLLKVKGFDGHQYKMNYIKRRIAVRMRATGALGYADYLQILQEDPQEPSSLLDKLTIHVTQFFRDPEVYQAIKKKVIPLIVEKKVKRLKVWCAGCSTGEEPYSLAILLNEWKDSNPTIDFEIYATDIDLASIRTASKGEYPIESLQKLSRAQVSRWFQVQGLFARVTPELKTPVSFRTHDLLGQWPSELGEFNMILCRNMLIYLTTPQQQKIYEQFASSLMPEGVLVLGLTETLLGPARKFYHCIDIRHRIYQLIRPSQTISALGSEE